MNKKRFSERLNKELDSIGVPAGREERIHALAKLVDIPKFKAEALLNGSILAGDPLIHSIAEVLEVTPAWLLGQE